MQFNNTVYACILYIIKQTQTNKQINNLQLNTYIARMQQTTTKSQSSRRKMVALKRADVWVADDYSATSV